DLSKVLEDFSTRFDVMHTAIKKYPVMYGNETAIEAFLALVERYNLTAEEIEEVDVKFRSEFANYSMSYHGDSKEQYHPSSAFSASMSIPYNLAIAMAYGDVRVEHFEDERALLSDERLARFATKVKGGAIPEFDQMPRKGQYTPSRVTITTKDGRSLTETRINPRGDPDNFMTEAEIVGKFKDTAGRVMDPAKLDPIVEQLLQLEKIADIRKLTRLLG